jgi:hypothetical protein
MELFSDGPSKLETTSSVVEEDKPVWIEEISLAEADSILEQAFFPFKQVPYLPFAFSTWSPPSDNKTDEPVFEPFVFQDKHREEGSEVVVVKTDFEPMLISSMKTVKESMAIFGRMESIFPGLYQWIEAAKPTAKYGVGNFRAFAPPSEGWAVGVPYYVVSNKSNPAMEHPPLQMPPHRYHPPLPEGREVLMHALLSQFHPNVFLGMRFEPRGTLAVIRAVNEHYYDIAIRSHAEYQLNSKPDLPFWFTPAQFNGRLVISKDFKHLLSFKLWVPTNKQLNIDMEWLTKPDGETNQVDIGYIPKMELFSDGPSKLETTLSAVEEGKPVWIEEISLAEADSILEQAFFPFKQVPYLPFAEAFDLASEQQKPVHHILLWGALDDQSC